MSRASQNAEVQFHEFMDAGSARGSLADVWTPCGKMSASAQLTTTVDRVFVKRTRRGQVKTHVRQTYLRDDLPSGSPHIDGPELEPRLSASATRYLVLDTNVVLHQIDLLERPTLCDVIVTQTVLDEVRHNKISVHKRLRALITDGMPHRARTPD